MKKQWYTPPALTASASELEIEFELQPLTRAQLWDLSDHMQIVGGRPLPTAAGRKLLARLGITDWRGVTDSEGAELRCPVGNLSAMLAALPFHVLDAVAVEVWRLSLLQEEERKNS